MSPREVLAIGRRPPSAGVFSHVSDADRRQCYQVPGVEFNTELALVGERFSRRQVKVECPHCGHLTSPLNGTPRTKFIHAGWRGVEEDEPFEDWLCACGGCGGEYRLTTFTPQR